jgi:hypothetical protein
LLLGRGEISGASGVAAGPMTHIQLGGFPTRELGLVFDLGLGWRSEDAADTVYEMRPAGEVQFFPLAAGKLHGGGYAQLGAAYRSDDAAGKDRRSGLWGAGAMLQLDLTTTLALTARAGVTGAIGEETSDLTVGLSIY